MQISELTGQTQTHLAQVGEHLFIHKEAVNAYLSLQNEAKKSGFNLQIASGFRSFDRQLQIWNNKFSGKSVLRNRDESIIDVTAISELEKLYAILHWSALPGASRHHWGTDFDVYDPTLLPSGQKLQLTCQEYQQSGYFHALSLWLNENMAEYDFYRPYAIYQGGVANEPWHISYRPIAEQSLKSLTIEVIYDLIMRNNVLGKSLICQQLPIIYKQFITNIN